MAKTRLVVKTKQQRLIAQLRQENRDLRVAFNSSMRELAVYKACAISDLKAALATVGKGR